VKHRVLFKVIKTNFLHTRGPNQNCQLQQQQEAHDVPEMEGDGVLSGHQQVRLLRADKVSRHMQHMQDRQEPANRDVQQQHGLHGKHGAHGLQN